MKNLTYSISWATTENFMDFDRRSRTGRIW